MLRDDLTYYWFSEIIQEDSLGERKIAIKHYMRLFNMDFDKVLSLFNQDSILEFISLTCVDSKDEKRQYTLKSEEQIVDDAFLSRLIVYNKKEKISALREQLKKISYRLSSFSFFTSDGIRGSISFNNKRVYSFFEVDLEIPIEFQESFLKTVTEVDKSMGAIMIGAEKYLNCFLVFHNDKLVTIFPRVYDTRNATFRYLDNLNTNISTSFIENLDPYPGTMFWS